MSSSSEEESLSLKADSESDPSSPSWPRGNASSSELQLGSPKKDRKRSMKKEKSTSKPSRPPSRIIELNVGGHYYSTTLDTLTKYPKTMLGAMFSGKYDSAKDRKGRYFIDRDGEAFGVILNFLRNGQVHYGNISKELVLEESNFYGIPLDETLDPALEVDMVNLDLQGEKNIISVFRKATLSSWREYSVKTIKKMMPKLVYNLTHIVKQNGGFGATIAFYQNEKKKDSLAASWEKEGIKAGVSWYDVIIYLEKVEQPLIEMWCAYLKLQGFKDIRYIKRSYPVLHWSIELTWNLSPMEDQRVQREVHHVMMPGPSDSNY